MHPIPPPLPGALLPHVTAVQGDSPAAHPGASSASAAHPPFRGISVRSHPLQQRQSSPKDARLNRLAAILRIDIGSLDGWLSGVTWGQHPRKETYAVRLLDDEREHTLYFDGIGEVTEFSAALLKDKHDTSAKAVAAREIDALMTELAMPRVQAMLLDRVKPVTIGGEMFHLLVNVRDTLRAEAVLDDGSMLSLVWQEQHSCYVPAADVGPQPPSLRAGPAAVPGMLLSPTRVPGEDDVRFDRADSGVGNALYMPLFREAQGSQAAILIEEDPPGVWQGGSGKRAAPVSAQKQASRGKRPRHDSRLEAGTEAEARWDAYRAGQEHRLPGFTQLPSSSRLLLQAAAMSVPLAMEFVQRDWQARRNGQPMAGQAIIEAHKQARFNRLARRVAGASSYENITLDSKAKDALESLPPNRLTAAALYEKLVPKRTHTTDNMKSHLIRFNEFLARQKISLYEVVKNFAAFAHQFEAYKASLGQGPTNHRRANAVAHLRDLCFSELPFQKRIEMLMKRQGATPQTLPSNVPSQNLISAGNFDTWLASKGYASDTVTDDVEGLFIFFKRKREAYSKNTSDRPLKTCWNLWRETYHPLLLDERFDAAIDTFLGADTTKALWRVVARRLAEYAWCHPIPVAGYVEWVRSLDLNETEWKKVCEWPGVVKNNLRGLVHHIKKELPAGAA